MAFELARISGGVEDVDEQRRGALVAQGPERLMDRGLCVLLARLERLGFAYAEETDNPVARFFLR